jgi:hypothetical protein
MLEEWHANWAKTYLDELYNLHSPPDSTRRCACGGTDAPEYSCDDCLSSDHLCKTCLVNAHLSTPCHRIMHWNGYAWSRDSLPSLGVILNLAAHPGPCRNSSVRGFVLGDITGFHEIKVAFCECASSPLPFRQLLQNHILPCSEAGPSTGFTFSVLRQYHFASSDAKMSATRFYTMMHRQTNNIMPHLHVNRYREFMRATREWMYLQDHKRMGHTSSNLNDPVSIANRCPACPRLGVNYSEEDVSAGQE